jgi:flagellar biosynthesis protein FlhF
MRIRRFTAATMQQALRQVKAVLGAEAVILEAGEADGVMTVTAAVDAGPAAVAPEAERPADRELLGEVRELLGVVRALVGEHWQGRRRRPRPELARLHQALVAQGVDGVIAAALVRETAERLERDGALDAALARALVKTDPSAAPRRVQLFLGPPGDGKTTTIAKLAAQARRAGRRAMLVNADTYRVGAAAELAAYARALGQRVEAAAGPEDVARLVAGTREAELVLVDTAGVGPSQAQALAELHALAEAAGPEAGRTLVLSAAAGSWAARHAWQAFAPLRPDACVLTKLDLAPGGPVLGLLWRRGVPVSHLAAGRRIPDDLEPATPARLARCLLAA